VAREVPRMKELRWVVAHVPFITREYADRLKANGWFLSEDALLGTIERGKYVDLVMPSANYFDEHAVSDEALKKVTSVLTFVGGTVVYGEPGRL